MSQGPVRGFCLWLLLGCSLAGCSRIMGDKPHEPIPAYPDGTAGLQQLATDMLHAAQAEDHVRIHDLLASVVMTRDELEWLFGPRAQDLAPAYKELTDALVQRGGVDLCAVTYEKKYDTVEVSTEDLDHLPFGPLLTDSPDVANTALARTLVHRPVIYTMHFKKAGSPYGTRYGFFFFHDGHWRTGNLLGRVIAKREKDEAPARLTEGKPAR